jgi:hypothetical protein
LRPARPKATRFTRRGRGCAPPRPVRSDPRAQRTRWRGARDHRCEGAEAEARTSPNGSAPRRVVRAVGRPARHAPGRGDPAPASDASPTPARAHPFSWTSEPTAPSPFRAQRSGRSRPAVRGRRKVEPPGPDFPQIGRCRTWVLPGSIRGRRTYPAERDSECLLQ